MEKKKQKTIRIVISSILLIFIGYVSFYWFLIKDEYSKYLFQVFSLENTEEPNTKISINLKIYEYNKDTCEITYYIINRNYKNITFPCDKLKENGFTNEGGYTINLYFDSYPFYPRSLLGTNLKKRLEHWEIIRARDSISLYTSREYLNGVKDVLKTKTFKESVSCLVSSNKIRPYEWICNKGDYFTNDYLQSLYLSYELGIVLDDEDLRNYVKDEIEYLNTNMQTILGEVQIYPESYILELINIGLNKEYLDIINRNNAHEEISENQVLKYGDCFGKGTITNTDILLFEKYSEYAKIFKEFKYNQLSNYYLEELYKIYNELPSNFSELCYIGNVTNNTEILSYVNNCLNKENNQDMIESLTFSELYSCGQFLTDMNSDTIKINSYLFDRVQRQTYSFEGSSYIISESGSILNEDLNNTSVLLNYRLLNNLKYIMYVQD